MSHRATIPRSNDFLANTSSCIRGRALGSKGSHYHHLDPATGPFSKQLCHLLACNKSSLFADIPTHRSGSRICPAPKPTKVHQSAATAEGESSKPVKGVGCESVNVMVGALGSLLYLVLSVFRLDTGVSTSKPCFDGSMNLQEPKADCGIFDRTNSMYSL